MAISKTVGMEILLLLATPFFAHNASHSHELAKRRSAIAALLPHQKTPTRSRQALRQKLLLVVRQHPPVRRTGKKGEGASGQPRLPVATSSPAQCLQSTLNYQTEGDQGAAGSALCLESRAEGCSARGTCEPDYNLWGETVRMGRSIPLGLGLPLYREGCCRERQRKGVIVGSLLSDKPKAENMFQVKRVCCKERPTRTVSHSESDSISSKYTAKVTRTESQEKQTKNRLAQNSN